MIFILGNHRTGTTILYKMLAATGRFCYPTPFHLVHFRDHASNNGRFDPAGALARMEERFARLGITDRFIDEIEAGPLTPEEYGFAMPRGRVRRRSLAEFSALCDFVRSNGGRGRTLLLKNPRDFAGFRFIQRAYPQARFVFIHRHPGPSIDSRIRELRLLFSRRSPYQAEIEPRYRSIWSSRVARDAVRIGLRPDNALHLALLWAFHRRARRFLRDLPRLPAASHVSITYEELCETPEAVTRRILAFAGIEGADVSHAGRMMQPTRRPPSRNPVLHSAMAARLLRPYLDHCGYDGLWPAGPATAS